MRRRDIFMKNRPKSVVAGYFFILANALIWLVLGIVIAINAHPAIPDTPGLRWTFTGLSFTMAAIILILCVLLYRRNRMGYFLTLALFIFNAVLTMFDNVGWSDLVVLALNIIPVILLILDRNWYIHKLPRTGTGV
jgi:chromate transport protein ChrA